jgi:DNA-binding beta-propeller fold protein YncE
MRWVLPILVIAAVAAPAGGHQGGLLDLEALEALVAQRTAEPTGRAGTYRRLDQALRRENARPFFSEIRKLSVVAAACRRRLASDVELVALLRDGLAQAAAYLGGRDEQIDAVVRVLERVQDRDATRRVADDALERLAAAAGEPSDVARAKSFRRCGATFARAERLAQKLLARQLARGAPGQPIGKGPSGSIDTYMGSGLQGADAQPRPALASSFSNPVDVALDADGRLYVVDLNNNQIRRLEADGIVQPVAGNGRLGDRVGPPLESELHHPAGIAFHPLSGELFVAGWHSARIVRLDAASGDLRYAAGSGELGFAGDGADAAGAVLDYPSGVVFAADGSWYLADQGNRRVRRVDGATNVIDTLAGSGLVGFAGDGGPALDAAFDLPSGQTAEVSGRICLSPDERFLYIADTGNHRVRRVDLSDPLRVIHTYAGDGQPGSGGDGGPATAASLFAAGNLFICERDGNRVRRVDRDTGIITTVAGSGARGFTGDGGPAADATLDGPTGIAVDRLRGRLYVADTLNHVIRVVWE